MTDDMLPHGRNISSEQVRQNFTWHENEPSDHNDLRFRLLRPKSWQEDPLPEGMPLSNQALAPLALFSSMQPGFCLQVQAVFLDREISAGDWLRHFMTVSGYEMLIIRELSAFFADSLCQFAIEGTPFRGRIAVRIHGNLLFMVSGLCPTDDYEALAEVFGVCIASFKPVAELEHLYIETHLAANVSGILNFQYPASWTLQPQTSAVSGKTAVNLISFTANELSGLMRIKVADKKLPGDRNSQFDDAVDEFSEAGFNTRYQLVDAPVTINNERFLSGLLQVFAGATSAGLPQELWVIVLEDDDYYVTIDLLTPERQKHFFLWAQNRRSLDIITSTLL